jgi:hypothetical protein
MGEYKRKDSDISALDGVDETSGAVKVDDVTIEISDDKLAFKGGVAKVFNFSGLTINAETTGTMITTGSTWLVHPVAGACAAKILAASSATSGDYATLRMRARSDGANPAGGVVCGNFSASANVDEYANLYAVQGYAQPNAKAQTGASNIVCGVYSCVDRTVGSSGRSWSLWTDTHETAKASASHFLHRLSHNGGAINLDGIWTIYAGQGCDSLMNFENTNAPVTSGDMTGGTKTYSLAVKINGAVHYIQCYAAA